MTTPSIQATTLFDSLKNYHKGLATYIGGGSPVSANEAFANIDFSALLKMAIDSQKGGALYVGGYSTNAVHTAVAINRDLNLRNRTKASYFIEGAADHLSEADYYDSSQAKHLAGINVMLPFQTGSV